MKHILTSIASLLALTLLGCTSVNPRVATGLNEDAALKGDLLLNPLQGKVITSWVDKTDKQHPTMSTLYGNDIAIQFARGNAGPNYPAGSVLSLVTWNQQEDERWFGGNTPAGPRSVEIVTVGPMSYRYQRYAGTPLQQVATEDAPKPGTHAQYLLAQRAAVMP